MNDRADDGQEAVRPGLCVSCRHARIVTSDRGQQFWFCERSQTNPAFPKYPTLPVLTCAGYEPAPEPTREAG